MTRNDIRVQFNKEKDLHVLQTEGTGYIHYTDDYVHWLEDIALMQANGVEQSTSNCNIANVVGRSEQLVCNSPVNKCPSYMEDINGEKGCKGCEYYY